jgi:hypothetical protein
MTEEAQVGAKYYQAQLEDERVSFHFYLMHFIALNVIKVSLTFFTEAASQ